MHNPRDRIAHTMAFGTPVVEHWLEREIAEKLWSTDTVLSLHCVCTGNTSNLEQYTHDGCRTDLSVAVLLLCEGQVVEVQLEALLGVVVTQVVERRPRLPAAARRVLEPGRVHHHDGPASPHIGRQRPVILVMLLVEMFVKMCSVHHLIITTICLS